MRGLVLGFDKSIGTGLMRGDDGKRYVFAIDDWLSKPRPRPGQMVDFELHKGVAMEVFLIKNASGFDASGALEALNSLWQQVALLARDIRISSRLVVPLAVLIAFSLPVLASGGREFSGYNIIGFLRQSMQTASSMSALGSEETRSVMQAARTSLYLYLGLYALPVYAAFLLMQLGAKNDKRSSGLTLPVLCVALPALLPPLVLGLFYALSPAGAVSLKMSILSSLSIAMPDAYLIYGQGVVILLAIGVLGLIYALRKPRGKKADKPIKHTQTIVQPAAKLPSQQSASQPQRPQAPQVRPPQPQKPVQNPRRPAQQSAQRPVEHPVRPQAAAAQNTVAKPQDAQPTAAQPVSQLGEAPSKGLETNAIEEDINEILRQIHSENS